MSYQVLPRKWRPRTFETLVGQEPLVKALRHALDEKRLHHAYLFPGPPGTGRTTPRPVHAKAGPQKIPVTVLSRCLQFNLKQMPSPAIAAHLGKILGEEKTSAEGAALALLADCARGSMRDALSLLDQAIAYSGGKVTEQAVRSMLGAIDETYLYSILEGLARGDAAAVLAIAEDMRSRSVAFDGALQDLGALVHRVALARAAPDAVDATGGLGG